MTNRMAEIVDLRARRIERQLGRLRRQQATGNERVDRLTGTLTTLLEKLRHAAPAAAPDLTVERVRQVSEQAREISARADQIRRGRARLRRDIRQLCRRRDQLRRVLHGLRQKRDALEARAGRQRRIAQRRRERTE